MASRISSYVVETRFFHTDDKEGLGVELNQMYRDLSQAVNQRTIGNYATESSLTGNKLYGIQSRAMATYRVLLTAPSILNGVTTVPHGIVSLENVLLLSLTGGASAFPNFLPMPYVNVGTPGDGIQLSMDATNVYLTTTTADYVGYSALIVVEYARP
jgi:hypothetical protein